MPRKAPMIMGLAESLKVSLLGFAVVFCVLALISLFLVIVSKIMTSTAKKPAEAPASAPVPAPAAPQRVPADGSLGSVRLFDVDDKTAAMVMAIVADQLKAPLNELRFISIKERKKD